MKIYINKSNELLLVIAIVLLGFFLRIYALSDVPPSLYIDEIWSVYNPYLAQQGLLGLSLRGTAVHLLLGNYFTYSLFGASTFFARLPSVIFGTGLVFLVYLLSKNMFGKWVGLIAAILTAISPWGIQFSRYSVPASNYVFFFVLSLYLMYKGVKIEDERKKFLYCGLGVVILGLVTYTHIVSVAFIIVFLFGFVLFFTKKLNKKVIINGVKYLFLGLSSASLTIYEFLNPVVLSNAGLRVSGSYSVFSLSENLWDLITNIFERIYYHLSPDFLVTTGGGAFVSNTGFSETISHASLLRYGTLSTGVLNYYGVIIYPALLYFLYKIIKRSSLKEERLLIWWVFAYAVASAVSYYDNPNAARNIVGLPALIIVMSVFLFRGLTFVHTRLKRKLSLNKSKIITSILCLTIITSIATATVYYINDYFVDYPVRAATDFNYEYKTVADYLTAEALWNNNIYVKTDPTHWYSQQIISFYSPNQPPSNIFAVDDVESSWPFQEDMSKSIFITQSSSDLEKLEELGIPYVRKQDFKLPNGETALYLVELQFPEILSPVMNGFTKEEYRISVFNDWNVGRCPKELNLKLEKNDNYSLLINYDYSGNVTDWWHVSTVFENEIDLDYYSLFEITWNVQKEGAGSTFIQFLAENEDGQKSWVPDNRIVYPAKRYFLSNLFENYSKIVGLMIGDELQNGASGKIVISQLTFFNVKEADIQGSFNSKWNWVDVEGGGLLINRDANVTFPLPVSNKLQKYLSMAVVPLEEGCAYVTIAFNNDSIFQTRIDYLDELEASQTFLIVFETPRELKSIFIQTKSLVIIFGFWSGT